MADKKSGYEKASEASDAAAAAPTSGSPAKQGEPIKLSKTVAPRTVAPRTVRKLSADLRAMSQINSILEKFPPMEAMRILTYCEQKQGERTVANIRSGPTPTDPRAPGGYLYTPPFPGMKDFESLLKEDRDHG